MWVDDHGINIWSVLVMPVIVIIALLLLLLLLLLLQLLYHYYQIPTGNGVLNELDFPIFTLHHDIMSLLIYLTVVLVFVFMVLRFFVKKSK